MRFPFTFYRYVGTKPAGAVTLGADGDPTGTGPKDGADNVAELLLRLDRPTNRIVIGYVSDATSPKALTVDVYLFAKFGKMPPNDLGEWVKVSSSAAPLAPGTLTYVGIPGGQPPVANPSSSLLQTANQDNSESIYLKVNAAGSDPDGKYTFFVTADTGTGGGISQGL